MQKEMVSIFGSGAFGTALAQTFARNNTPVRMWGRSHQIASEINKHRRNLKYSGVCELHSNIEASTDLEYCLKDSKIWVYACPSLYFTTFLKDLSALKIAPQPLINTCKGLEPSTHSFYHNVATQILGLDFTQRFFICLSGPSFASEILENMATCVTISGFCDETLLHIQRQLSNSHFRMYSNTDLIGTQLGGAMKNVLAIAAGAISGLGLGYNTQAAIINMGLGEMARLGEALGARIETFLGFSGVGDLILTCTSPLSRNRTFGFHMGAGHTIEESMRLTGSTIEGFAAAHAIRELARQLEVRTPICEQVFQVLHCGVPIIEAMQTLLAQPPRAEWG